MEKAFYIQAISRRFSKNPWQFSIFHFQFSLPVRQAGIFHSYVPSFQLAKYCTCSGVSVSIWRPITWSCIAEIC